MASIKRKAVTDERPSKKAKAVASQEDKKPTRDSSKASGASKPNGTNTDSKKPATKSILQQEERAFPRGGASVLTPLEHRQIKAQAERDVLLEQETGQPQNLEEELFDGIDHSTSAKKGKKTKKSKSEFTPKVEGSGVKISGLSYKNLLTGSVVLGRVTAISSKDIALALPNNLTGYAPITNISERLNGRIEKLLANEEKVREDQEDDEDDIDIKQIFHIGQWLRATVVSTSTGMTERDGKSKRHIELSLDPGRVNVGLTSDSASVNSMVQGSVRSVEDHGIIMDLGNADDSMSGFISKKELGGIFELGNIQQGQVMLCLITGKGSNGKVLKLSPDVARFSVSTSAGDKIPILNEAPTLDTFQPGTAVTALITESGPGGVVGKLMGMQDVVADVLHSGANTDDDMSQKYKIGSKAKARIMWSLPDEDGSRRMGISFLEHLLALTPAPSRLPPNATQKQKSLAAELDQKLSSSSIVEQAKVVKVSSERGLYLQIPDTAQASRSAIAAFAHISQVADDRIDTLSSSTGPYKLETLHQARILTYNPVDNLYYVSLKPSTLSQSFLRLEDLVVGEVVNGTVDKLILGGTNGIVGVLIRLSDNVSALVPEMHLSDTQLKHPERKFREGQSIKARILSVDVDKRQARLTLKKTLVENKESHSIWKSYKGLQPGMEGHGTIARLLPQGAAVQFYGSVRAWLPIAEMSESFVQSPEAHFRLGQTVHVRILSVDADAGEMKVSCKDDDTFDPDKQALWDNLSAGNIVNGVVAENNVESVTVELQNGIRGTIRVGHFVDGSAAKAESALKRIRVGQKVDNLLVLAKLERSRMVLLSDKPSLISDAKSGDLIRTFQDATVGQKARGFVRNITLDGVYVEFGNRIVAMLPKSQILPELLDQLSFGFRQDQSVAAWIIHVDPTNERISLSMREPKSARADTNINAKTKASVTEEDIEDPVDSSITSMADFTLGRVTQARVASVKATQVNVRLAKNVQGRIDVSEAFDSWEEIANKAAPLQKFKQNQVIDVKILGIHDARSHRFLPISHRQGKVPVFELSAKKSRVQDGHDSLLSMESVTSGSSHIAFVNNHSENCVWVNLSPNVRGRITLMDLSDDVGILQDVERRVRIGSALRVAVKNVDAASNKLDLTAKLGSQAGPVTLQDLSPGTVIAARITKITEHSVIVQLSDNLVGPVGLVELSDDYDQANLAQYTKNDIVRVCVIGLDLPNKKVFLSLRPSKVLSSSLPVKDPQITSTAQLKPGDIVRGFVKQVSDKGVFVSLGAQVDAFVRISDLSDQYIKDWKSIFSVDQLVKGRVISIDPARSNVQLSLKASQVDKNYRPPITINDLQEGQTVTGKVRKVEDFGAFIDIDNTQPRLSGLCHRSEVAAKRVDDVRALYSAGDVVKAKIIQVDVQNRKISLGLKAEYFDEEASEAEDDEDGGVDAGLSDPDDADAFSEDSDGGVEFEDDQQLEDESEDDNGQVDAMDVDHDVPAKVSSGLKTSGFDWTGDDMNGVANGAVSDSEHETALTKKRKRNKSEIKVDMTGELDKYGPRSVSDFERQLLGQPNNSGLWIQYMAFQLQLSEVQKARDIAERALRTIHIRETEEKANIWIAWLNLEVEYSDDEHVEEVFKQACQLQDSLEMHEKLASIYIDSGKHDKADSIFERMTGNKSFRASPDVWYNYASFLMDSLKSPARARALLSRALQSIPNNEHRSLTAKFAALEFRSAQGDIERGRTIFEGLISEWPKWSSGWDMWADIERSRITSAESDDLKDDAREKVRALFGRMSTQKMKKRRAKFVFKKWLEFEEGEGSAKHADRVKALAKEYVERLQNAGDDEMEE